MPTHTVTPSLDPLCASHRWSTGVLTGSFCELGLLRPADNTIKVGSVGVDVARVCERGKMTGTNSLTFRKTPKNQGAGSCLKNRCAAYRSASNVCLPVCVCRS